MMTLVFADASPLAQPAVFERYYRQLSPFRRDKADQLKNAGAKRLSVAAAAVLDRALDRYGLRERDMDYTLIENGKPCFKNAPALHFNLSHSGGMVMAAVGDVPLGCDIEQLRPIRMRLAQRYFTFRETQALCAISEDAARTTAFFRLWTMKESYLKLTGQGLALALDAFEIDMAQLTIVNKPAYRLFAFTPAKGYQAALCCSESTPCAHTETILL